MALSIGIIATSIIYASLSVLGIPKSISLLVSLVILIGLNLFFLFKNPQSFFSSRDRIQEGNIFERAVTRKSQVHEFVSSEKITETVTSESMKKGSLVTAEKVGLNRVSRRKDSLAVLPSR